MKFELNLDDAGMIYGAQLDCSVAELKIIYSALMDFKLNQSNNEFDRIIAFAAADEIKKGVQNELIQTKK